MRWWHAFCLMTRNERRSITLLLFIITVWSVVLMLIPHFRVQEHAVHWRMDSLMSDSFIQTLRPIAYESGGYSSYRRIPVAIQSFRFDPNSLDSAGFVLLGLQPWMAKNIIAYRSKGGKFRRRSDFKKVYGLPALLYDRLLPLIALPDTIIYAKDSSRWAARDTSIWYKYPVGTVVELNSADTTQLKRIPNVGIGFARRIISYRSRLGGFYRVDQLREVPGMDDLLYGQIENWFKVDPLLIVPIDVNRSSLERLMAHPYMGFYRAKAMIELKRKRVTVRSLDELKLYDEFADKDRERLVYYLKFD